MKWSSTYWYARAGALVLWALAALCFYVVALCLYDTQGQRHLNLALFRAGLVGILGLVLIRLGSVVALTVSKEEEAAAAALWVGAHALREELDASVARFAKDARLLKAVEHVEARHWQAAEEALLSMAPPESNAYVAFSLSTLREAQGDIAGAEAMLICAKNQMGARVAPMIDICIVSKQLQQQHIDRAKETSRKLIESIAEPAEKVRVMDGLACIPIMEGLRSYLDEADRISREALELEPQSLTLQGTRGSILVELGRLGEGKKMLEDVYARSKAVHDRGICALYLGLAAKSEGKQDEARAWGQRAKKLCPEEWLMRRVNVELEKGA
jgi:hypothetical protein